MPSSQFTSFPFAIAANSFTRPLYKNGGLFKQPVCPLRFLSCLAVSGHAACVSKFLKLPGLLTVAFSSFYRMILWLVLWFLIVKVFEG